jgi:glycosyltransferase involved in cell wall biosynthesis
MADFVLVTHTRWSEAPRIRHQVARLLVDAGHRVLFLERADYPWSAAVPEAREVEPRLTVARTTRLIHHQFRVLPSMHRLDAAHVSRRLRDAVARWGATGDFTVVNFTHDGWFLREAFPGHRIVTIIHDDFEGQSRLPFAGHITWTLERTCRGSDAVLAVSEPLRERLSAWCTPELFLPWAVVPYRPPVAPAAGRRTLLFWGYVDTGIDLDRVEEVAAHLAGRGPDWKVLLVGPTQGKGVRAPIVSRLSRFPNIEVRDPMPLDALPLEETLAALLPYRRSPITDSVTLANKSMQLLARGLPLLISAMPRFLEAPFVIRFDGPGGIGPAVDACVERFESLQPSIREYCAANSPESRLRRILPQ